MLGAVTGVMGTLQATEVLKEILGVGEKPVGPAADLGRAGHALPHRAAAARPHCALCSGAGNDPGPVARQRGDAAGPACAV